MRVGVRVESERERVRARGFSNHKWQRPETSSEDSMPITFHLFEAYLKCPTKCFLRSRGETATENSYANWVRTRQLSYTSEGIKQLVKGFAKDEVITETIDSEETQSPEWRLAIQTIAHTRNLESIIHAVEHRTPEGEDKPASIVPIKFINTNKVHKHDKLSLAFDSLALSQMLGRDIVVGNIIYGDDHTRLTVNTGALTSAVRAVTEKIDTFLSSNSPPELILNRHCPECEFKDRCTPLLHRSTRRGIEAKAGPAAVPGELAN